MELLLRVRGAAGRVDDVTVGVDPDHTVAELAVALGDRVGVRPDGPGGSRIAVWHDGCELCRDDQVVRSGLLSGDEVVLAAPGRDPLRRPPPSAAPSPGVVADVIGGPDAGRSMAVPVGRWAVGRGRDVALRIADPTVSRHHLDLDVAPDGAVVVHPMPGNANGVTVDERAITAPTAVSGDDVVGLGGTRLLIRRVDRPTGPSALHGRTVFHRTPYRPPIVVDRRIDTFGPIPSRPEPRRLQVATLLAPLVAGLALFAFTRQVQFLALTLISPIAMSANAVEDRRAGRRTFTEQVAEFRSGLAAHRARVAAMRDAERVDRLRLAPDLADLVRRAEWRTIDLWARGRSAPDFLRVRLGLGTAATSFSVGLAAGGDADLRREAAAALDGLDRLDHVPVSADLGAWPVFGIAGDRGLVDGVVASLLVQAAVLHSPDDLVVAAAVGGARPLGWLAWLPHQRSAASPLQGRHLAIGRQAGVTLVGRLLEVAALRSTTGRRTPGTRCWPHLLVVLDADLDLDPADTARLLAISPEIGVSVIWMASTAAGVTHRATHSLLVQRGSGATAVGRLVATDPGLPEQVIDVEQLRPRVADRAARALAPLTDAAASSSSSIPTSVGLLDVFGGATPGGEQVARSWQGAGDGHLRFPVGVGADGVLELDLVDDGPHTLIGGTSGSGKSELLQSMVASLAVRHPPTRVNFLFVDYKGGAAAQAFHDLPHTVGVVTNLDDRLADRALTSLRAELQRRMAVLEGRAKDVTELSRIAPAEAPPALVIVVDEFATLVKEVPGFVDGIVDVAQRGRSLGFHLVLATQRPTGAVNENILANTNARIALRMLDAGESTAIIGGPEAADIPVALRGRAIVRLGPRRRVEFQSAFGGALLVGERVRSPLRVAPLVERAADSSDPAPAHQRSPGGCQLDVVLAAVADANRIAGHRPPRRPWCDPLPAVVTLDEVSAVSSEMGDRGGGGCDGPGRSVVVGLVDEPEYQRQRPAVIDLEAGGGLLVFGSGASGATTLLRTIALSIDRDAGAGAAGVATLAVDFGSGGLDALRGLPTVIDVASGHDLEAVTRHLTMLDLELERRRRSLTEQASSGGIAAVGGIGDIGGIVEIAGGPPVADLPRIVVLIDGFAGFADSLIQPGERAGPATDRWSELITRLAVEGRRVGIHTVITAERRSAVPARLHSAVANRLILRHADEAAYSDHGVQAATARGLFSVPGRGLLNGAVVQIASVSGDPSGPAQIAEIARRAAVSTAPPVALVAGVPLPGPRLPERVRLGAAAHPPVVDGSLRVPIGITDVTGAVATVDLAGSHLAVSGPPRSGRSTALATIAASLPPDLDVFVVGPPSSPLARLDVGRPVFGSGPELAAALDRLVREVGARPAAPITVVVVVDDADELDDPGLGSALERLASLGSVRLVGAVGSRSMTGYAASPAVGLLRRARRQLLLQPDDPGEFLHTTGVRLVVRPWLTWPPGRGVLLTDRVPTVVQVAVTSDATLHPVSRARLPAGPGRPAAAPGAVPPSASSRGSAARRPAPERTERSHRPDGCSDRSSGTPGRSSR